MLTSLILFAQEETKGEGGFLPSNPLFYFMAIAIAFLFLVVLPGQRRQRQEQEKLLSSLKKNDEVVTTAGIFGTVSHIDDNGEKVTLKIDDNARIRVLRTSIARIIKKDESSAPAVKKDESGASNTNVKTNA